MYWDDDARLQFHCGQWKLLSVDKAQQAKMYLLPYEQFGSRIFEEMVRHDEMRLSLDVLHQGLPRLYDACQAEGIELFYQTKPVALAQWEFSLDVQRHGGIDWFELRPEICCDGQLMTKSEVNEVMQASGVMEKDGVAHIFSLKAQEAFRVFSSACQQVSV